MANDDTKTRWIPTPPAILSFPHLFEPQQDDDGKDKWSAALVWPEGTDISEGLEIALAVGQAKWPDFLEGVKSGKYHMPFRNDGEEKGYPEGSVFLNARSGRRPGLVSNVPDAKGLPTKITEAQATDPDHPFHIYPGVIVQASLTAFTFERKGKKGVSFGLNNLMRVGDGERLDSFTSAQSEFEADPDAVADLSDLTGDEEPEAKVAPKGGARKKSGLSLDDLMGGK